MILNNISFGSCLQNYRMRSTSEKCFIIFLCIIITILLYQNQNNIYSIETKKENKESNNLETEDINPSLVGGGHKVVTPSFMSSRAVNNDFYDSKPECKLFKCIILNF